MKIENLTYQDIREASSNYLRSLLKEDIDFDISVNVTGKWHDEFPDYLHIKCKESWQC